MSVDTLRIHTSVAATGVIDGAAAPLAPVLVRKIQRDIIDPAVENDVADMTIWRFRCRKINTSMEIFTYTFGVCATILIFTSSYYGKSWIGYVAGVVQIVSVMFGWFAKYSSRRSTSYSRQIDQTIAELKKKQYGIPDLEIISEPTTPVSVAPLRVQVCRESKIEKSRATNESR